ncbi:predicted protein, partial [Postia placenta Mad-698-R]
MKCDGIRPICGQCICTDREMDCEYTDGPMRSPTQLLEDKIAQLESQIYDLEHPEETAPSVLLHRPRTSSSEAGSTDASISSAIVEEPRHNLIDLIQAEVLLAVYFYSSNRFLEGRYHCNAAIALTLSHRLNDMNSAQPQLGRDLLLPNDVFTSEEWNDAFWAVFTLDKVWGAVAGLESHFNGAQTSQVGIPWPLETMNYSTSGITSACWGVRAAKVLSIGRGTNTSADAAFILHAKAAALFERVSRLASQWKASLGSTPLTI